MLVMDIGRSSDLVAGFLLLRRGSVIYPILIDIKENNDDNKIWLSNWKEVGDYIPYNRFQVVKIDIYNILNEITRIATVLEKKQIERLVQQYLKDPSSLKFKLQMLLAKIKSSIVAEPKTYLQLILLSHNGSYFNTMKSLPKYFAEGFSRYVRQFIKS